MTGHYDVIMTSLWRHRDRLAWHRKNGGKKCQNAPFWANNPSFFMFLSQKTRFLTLQSSQRSKTLFLQRKTCKMLEFLKFLKICWRQQIFWHQATFKLQPSSKCRFPCPIATKCGVNQPQVTSGSKYMQLFLEQYCFWVKMPIGHGKSADISKKVMSDQLFWLKLKD